MGESALMKFADDDTLPLRIQDVLFRPPVRILLVDDNDDFRRQAARFLNAEPGCTVVAFAASGLEAVEMARREDVDLVLMDISMPGMDGLEATRRIKARAGSPRVVIVTFEAGAPYRMASEAAQADGFLSKADLIRNLGPMLDRLFLPPPDSSERRAP